MLTAAPTEPQQADFVPRAELFSNMPRINQAEPAHLDVLGKQLDFDDLPLRWNGSQQAFELAPEVLERTENCGDLRQLSGLTASMRRQASSTARSWRSMPTVTIFRRIWYSRSSTPKAISTLT
ncbi:MAG: hypothetical protein ACLRWP_07375 [Bilophila wadsworthia]